MSRVVIDAPIGARFQTIEADVVVRKDYDMAEVRVPWFAGEAAVRFACKARGLAIRPDLVNEDGDVMMPSVYPATRRRYAYRGRRVYFVHIEKEG